MEQTSQQPVWAVIFISRLSEGAEGYREMAQEMMERVSRFPGFMGAESVREGELGITISYWRDRESIQRWADDPRHREAQKRGKEQWYQSYTLQVVRIEQVKNFRRK